MTKITTKFTKLFNTTSPIVNAPMAYAVTPSLAAAVTAGGGFGTMGAAFLGSAELIDMLKETRKILNVPEHEPVPVAMGFIGWILDMSEASDDPRIPAVLAHKPKAIWLAFGDDLGKYVKTIRDYDAKRDHKTLIILNVNSVEAAVRAANEWKVDAITVQGIEAGGHGGSEAPPLSILLQATLKALGPDRPPILTAGGVATGAQIASLLALGADAVTLGTRFLTTNECGYTPNIKEIIRKATIESTTRTLACDDVGRTNGWPAKHNGRVIVNKIMDDLKEGIDLEERRKRFDESKAAGAEDRLIIWCGIAAGLSDDLRSTKDLFAELHNDTVKSLQAAAALVSA